MLFRRNGLLFRSSTRPWLPMATLIASANLSAVNSLASSPSKRTMISEAGLGLAGARLTILGRFLRRLRFFGRKRDGRFIQLSVCFTKWIKHSQDYGDKQAPLR